MTHIAQYPSIVWDDLRAPVNALIAPASQYPSLAVVSDDGAGSKGVWAWQFAAGSDQYLHAAFQLPHGWLAGSDLYPHIHWMPADENAGNVRLTFEYGWVDLGENFPANSVLLQDDFATGESTLEHLLASFSAISGVGHGGLSGMLLVTIGRLGSHVNDTYADTIYIMEADIHVQLSRAGSGLEMA